MGFFTRAFAAVSCAALTLGGAPLHASVFDDAGIYPGDVIVNTVTGRSRTGPIEPAEVRLTISELPPEGTLRAFAHDPGGAERVPFRVSEYSVAGGEGPFRPSPPPVDRSGKAGAPVPLGLVAVREIQAVVQGAPVFLALQSRSLNIRSGSVDRAVLHLRSESRDDEEFVRLTETGSDTGLFTGWFNTAPAGGGQDGVRDGVMHTTANSRVIARFLNSSGSSDDLVVRVNLAALNPANVVFDARTGAPVNGVRLKLLDMDSGRPARVRGEDLRADFPASVVTGETVTDASGRSYPMGPGEFRFPYLEAGAYRLVAEPPDGYVIPSMRSDEELKALGADHDLGEGSRLQPFRIRPGTGLDFDIPADRVTEGSVTRISDPGVVEVGDLFRYEVSIESGAMGRIRIEDDLPEGVEFVQGSLAIDGRKVDAVLEEDGRRLVVPGLDFRGARSVEMSYAARVAPGVPVSARLESRTSVIETGGERRRMEGRHSLRLVDAFDLSEIAILGEVSAGGCNAPPPEGVDLSGIRILLETGDHAITDARGRFHFREIAHRPHVVQVDETTLPRHARLVACERNTRSTGSARSRFVDVRPGMMGRVDFHLEFDAAAMAAEDAKAARERDYAPASATVFDQAWIDAQPPLSAPRLLAPAAGATPLSAAVDVAILRRPDEKTAVSINGRPVPDLQREQALTGARGDIVLDRFRAARIREGRNIVHAQVFEADGTIVMEERREVLYVTSAQEAELLNAGSALESDGRAQPVLRFRLLGEGGVPLRPGTRVQVFVEAPFALMPLAGRDSAPASQTRPQGSIDAVVRENGELEFRLAPVLRPGTARISIHAGGDPIVREVRVSVPERPWVLVGLAEGTLAERHVRRHMRRGGDLSNDLSGRVALFAEGMIRGEWLMTLRLDSARDGGGEFSGLDPERDYIVYGDQSWQDDASPSRFPLYLRLSREGAELLVGDFDAEVSTSLIEMNRKMTGVRAVMENDRFRVMAFAAKTTQRHVEDRLAVDGTAGPYRLSRRDIVPHSETVRLVTLSRIDADEDFGSEELVAGTDYVIAHGTGEIILRRPVPAFDPFMRRHVLRVDYETDEDIESGVTAGIRAQTKLSERARIGGTVLHEQDTEGSGVDVTVAGLDFDWQATDALRLAAEVTRVIKDDGLSRIEGDSAELRAEFDDGSSTATAYLRSRRGNGMLDGDMTDERVDTLGVEFSAFLDSPPVNDYKDYLRHMADREGTYLEGFLLAEHNRDRRTRSRDGELVLVRREDGLERSIGFSGQNRESDEDRESAVFLLSRSRWMMGDFTFGAALEHALSSSRADTRDRMAFSAEHPLGPGAAFLSWEGARERIGGDMSGLISAGYRLDEAGDGSLSLGLSRGFAGGRSGMSFFAGGDKDIVLGENLTASFGLDGQKDLGIAGLPLGLTYGDPVIEDSFVTARAGLRHVSETWSAGIQAERRWGEDGDRGNIRFTADGELTEAWSIGGEARVGMSGESGATSRESRLRFSAARRRPGRSALDLLMLDYRGEAGEDRADGKLYASWTGHRPLGDASEVTMRHALKYQRLGTGEGSFGAFSHLAAVEYRHDLSERFDIGLHAAATSAGLLDKAAWSAGVSLGMTPFENGWLSAGYNFTGFEDEVFSEGGETGQGAFLQMRLKFDENILGKLFR